MATHYKVFDTNNDLIAELNDCSERLEQLCDEERRLLNQLRELQVKKKWVSERLYQASDEIKDRLKLLN